STATDAKPSSAAATAAPEEGRPPIFEIELTVSSGTYIRSIVHDIGLALESAAHVVKLTRTRQGEFVLDPPSASTVLDPAAADEGEGEIEEEGEKATEDEAKSGHNDAAPTTTAPAEGAGTTTGVATTSTTGPLELETFSGGCVEWSLLERAITAHAAAKKEGKEVIEGRDEDGWLEWERDLLAKCKEV
ncbi:hypothetical protein JCM3774_006468, partial [Rhodotorula dairenensis]